MRRFPAILTTLLLLVLGVLGAQHFSAPAASADHVEPVIWRFEKDYPGTEPDERLAVSTVYIKTHDGATWMSEFDPDPRAVEGPAGVKRLIDEYQELGIDVVAWFVPRGREITTQLAAAVQVIDAGVAGLFADVEPYAGFCDKSCEFLADNFWKELRERRPDARLGVIYDPRPQHWDTSATQKWLSVADVAAPMCYWETFTNQGHWSTPDGCVTQAFKDLARLAPGRDFEYIPMLQGDTSAAQFNKAVQATLDVGAEKVSVWRRGIVSRFVWHTASYHTEAILAATAPDPTPTPTPAPAPAPNPDPDINPDTELILANEPVPTPRASYSPARLPAPATPAPDSCRATLADGCLLQAATTGDIYVIYGSAKFLIADRDWLKDLGLSGQTIERAPQSFVNALPDVPEDGTLIREAGRDGTWVIYGGAKFPVQGARIFKLLRLNWDNIRTLPFGGADQIPLSPQDRTTFKELGSSKEWYISGGMKVELPGGKERDTLERFGRISGQTYTVPPGALRQVPTASGGSR
jgi:hypothetical protein